MDKKKERAGLLSTNKYKTVLFFFVEWLKGSIEIKERAKKNKNKKVPQT